MRIKSSHKWAALVALIVVGWMVSDNLFGSFGEAPSPKAGTSAPASDETPESGAPESGAPESGMGARSADAAQADVKPAPAKSDFIVSAVTVRNEMIPRVIRANGVSEPEFEVTVAAKINGSVVAVRAKEGNQVKAGDVLVVLDTGTLPEQISAARAEIQAAKMALNAASQQAGGTLEVELAAAKANLDVALSRLEISEKLARQNFSAPLEQVQLRADYENARVALAKIEIAQNFQADVEVSQSEARVKVAEANLAKLLEQLDDSTIRAPASGRLETLHVDLGERLQKEQAAASILGMDNLSIIVGVPQISISRISVDDRVEVDIAGIGSRQGIVQRIASKTNPATRTFDVEISVPNEDGSLRAGVTVEASINVGSVASFALSPAHLSVAGDGALTAKISEDGFVRSITVEMVRSGAERVYVAGLKDDMVLLTVGQAFVESGQPVKYVLGNGS